jgi:hypothetical protein
MEVNIIDGNKIIIEKSDEILSEFFSQNRKFNEFYDSNAAITTSDVEKEIFKFIGVADPDKTEIAVTPSMALFFTEREKYISELKAWEKEDIKSQHKETIEWLKKENSILALNELVQAIKRQKIAPFIGAGISASLGLPTWGVALKELSKQLYIKPNKNIEDLIDAYKYIQAAELLYKKNPQAFANHVEDKFGINPNWTKQDYFNGVLKYLPGISKGCVITTNFDKILENLFKHDGSSFEGFMHGSQADSSFVTDLIEGNRCLLKLHGSAKEKKTFVFTETQYDKAYGTPISFKNELPRTLRQIYISHSLLFLGCSLDQDKTLELFSTVQESGEYQIPIHFAILNAPIDKDEQNTKRDFLRNLNIKTICYPHGKHEYVEAILKLAIDISINKLSI